MYVPCSEEQATHVQVIADEHEDYKIAGVTPGYFYPVKRDEEGTPTLTTKTGEELEDFGLYLQVKWMKHITAQ